MKDTFPVEGGSSDEVSGCWHTSPQTGREAVVQHLPKGREADIPQWWEVSGGSYGCGFKLRRRLFVVDGRQFELNQQAVGVAVARCDRAAVQPNCPFGNRQS